MNFKKLINLDDFLSLTNAYILLTRLNPEKYKDTLDAFCNWTVELGLADPSPAVGALNAMMKETMEEQI
jgi:hypothetical protein